MEPLIDLGDLSAALDEINTSNEGKKEQIFNAGMSEEMQASQKRYEEYLNKHEME